MEYNKDEYENMWNYSNDENYRSALKILPILFKYYKPSSVIDIGCGVGNWLKAYYDLGITDIKGIDGIDMDESNYSIPKKYIETSNLIFHENKDNNKYDIVTSIEVAEHLPKEYSEKFIKMLISYGDIILFSAAIPHQDGTGHINCQPIQFWVDIFNKNGYDCFDFIRPEIMKYKDIQSYYSQNILLFVKKDKTHIFTKHNLMINNQPMFFYHPDMVDTIIYNIKNKILNSYHVLFGYFNDDRLFTLYLFGIKISFRKSRAEQSRAEQSRAEQSRAEQSR